jgi:uncharacterized protein (TIGR03437 family)
MALAVVALCGAARGQAPSYSAASIVNASDYSPGPFAPNSMLTIFGSNLAFSTAGLTDENFASLPYKLAGVSVYLDGFQVPLLYVSQNGLNGQGQINLLVPPNEIAGDATLWVDRQGTPGPMVTITLVNAAPALFPSLVNLVNFAMALDYSANNAFVTAAAPAQPGDLIVLYAAGLGSTSPNSLTGEIPGFAALISAFPSFQVLLNGKAIDPATVPYAGQAPGFPGVYQVNFYLPNPCPANPQIQLAIGPQSSAAGIILAVQ